MSLRARPVEHDGRKVSQGKFVVFKNNLGNIKKHSDFKDTIADILSHLFTVVISDQHLKDLILDVIVDGAGSPNLGQPVCDRCCQVPLLS